MKAFIKQKWFRIDQTARIFILTYSILLLIPEFFLIGKVSLPVYIGSLGFNYLFYLSFSYVLCVIGHILGRYIEKAWHTVWHVLIYFISISNVFLFVLFGLCWDPLTLTLLNETNEAEASGFMATYFASTKFYVLVFLYLCIVAVEVICLKCTAGKELKLGRLKWIAIPILVLMLGQVVFFSTDYNQNYRWAKGTPIKRNMLWKLEQSLLVYQENKKDFDTCSDHQEDVSIDSCSYRSPNIVIIVGEAYIKQHSGLYGYGKDTNPLLSKEDNIFLFNDVITSYNNTSESFKYFLSMASMDNKIKWCEAPLFPTILRKAGYHVTFYSNQFIKGLGQSRFEAKAGFISHPAIEPYIIDSRNSDKFTYDAEMISQYMKDQKMSDKHPYNLFFFHLFGQHVRAKDRYPEEFDHFHASDYQERTELSEKQRQEVAEYDNATRYNDYVVHQIINIFKDQDAIVIYFSDHGDEVNDYRPQIGRSYDYEEMGSKGIHCQFDIPFFIYTTNLYRENHPEIVQEIEASTNRRFMTDDLPHLVLYLAGIGCQWYDSGRNLISPQFQNNRQRLVSAKKFDYDEYCRTH